MNSNEINKEVLPDVAEGRVPLLDVKCCRPMFSPCFKPIAYPWDKLDEPGGRLVPLAVAEAKGVRIDNAALHSKRSYILDALALTVPSTRLMLAIFDLANRNSCSTFF